jgi:hypothetical protein
MAAGNVWFDHPRVGKVGCLSHETVQRLYSRDLHRDKAQHFFDWKHFLGNQLCLRLNMHGHTILSKTAFNIGSILYFLLHVLFFFFLNIKFACDTCNVLQTNIRTVM